MQRINVAGTPGCGKSTLARTLSDKLGIAHIECDSICWEPGWKMTPRTIANARLRAAMTPPAWVLDGNLSPRDAGEVEALSRIDTLIWLDYPLPLILCRHAKRFVQRVVQHQPCCNGNYESLQRVLSRDSIILWAIKTHYPRRKTLHSMINAPEYAHINFVRLRSPRQTRKWLRGLKVL